MNLTCDKCPLSSTCPRVGSSPLVTKGKKVVKCELIGNYGNKPVDREILSDASKALCEKNGPCTSYVEVPFEDEHSGLVAKETVIVFHQPIVHPRDKLVSSLDIMNLQYRRTHKI